MSEIPILESEAAFDRLVERSSERDVVIFKHSLTCPISFAAHERFLRFVQAGPDVELAMIEVQRARAVSNAVAERTGVRHESPQALVLRGGSVVWHASHGAIQEDALERAVAAG